MDTWRNVSHVSKLKKKERKRIKRKQKVKKERKEETGRKGVRREKREEREREREKKIFSLISKIYENQTVGFCQSKRQSRSTHRELRVGTKILEFRQTPRGREFSYFDYFSLKVI